MKTSVADPVNFFSDPDPRIRLSIYKSGSRSGWPKNDRIRPGSGSGFYLDMFLMLLFWQNCILDNFLQRENLNYKGLFVDKGSGSSIFPDPDPGDPKRPDPTTSISGSATLVKTYLAKYRERYVFFHLCITLTISNCTMIVRYVHRLPLTYEVTWFRPQTFIYISTLYLQS